MDEGALVRDLVEVRGSALKRYGFLLSGDEDRADDLVQEAILRVLTRRHPQNLGELERYVRRVMVNIVVDESRRARVWARIRPVASGDARHGGPGDLASEACDRLWVQALLKRLPVRQRACLVLRYYEDLPVPAIAQMLGCSEGTVKSQLHDGRRALIRFRDELDATASQRKEVGS